MHIANYVLPCVRNSVISSPPWLMVKNFGIIQEDHMTMAYGFKPARLGITLANKIYEIAGVRCSTLTQTHRNDWHHFRGQYLLCLLSGEEGYVARVTVRHIFVQRVLEQPYSC